MSQVLLAHAAEDGIPSLVRDDDFVNAALHKASAPRLGSAIALIYDEQGQRPLYSKNADTVVPIASITKLMTAMVILDAKLPLDEPISIEAEDRDRLKGSRSRMRNGMTLTRGELLKLALMASENQAAAALARTYQMQTSITQSELNINVLSNQGKAEYQRSIQQAAQIRALAEAEAEKIARIGIAQALATEEQVWAYGGPQFQVTQTVLNRFAEAIQESHVDVVPQVLIGADKDSGSGNIMQALLAMLLSDRFTAQANSGDGHPRSEEAEKLRAEIRRSLTEKKE